MHLSSRRPSGCGSVAKRHPDARWRNVVSRWRWAALLLALPCIAAMAVPPPLPAPNLKIGIQGEVLANVFLPDGSLILGGRFSQVNGVARGNLAKLKPDGSLDPTWNPNADGSVQTLALSPDGTAVYVGGDFNRVANAERQHLAKLSVSGAGAAAGWSPSIDGMSPDGTMDVNPVVNALAVASNGDVYIGGEFWHVGGQQRASIARVSAAGVLASWYPNGAYAGDNRPGVVKALVLGVDQSALFVGGEFSQIAATKSLINIAKISTGGNGAALSNWRPSINDFGCGITAIAIDPDNARKALYVAGCFDWVNGEAHQYLARLDTDDGTVDPWWMPSPNNLVYALAVDVNHAVYAGGYFSRIGSNQLARNGVARLLGATGDQNGRGSADLGWQADVGGNNFNDFYSAYAYVHSLALSFDHGDQHQSVGVGGYYGKLKNRSQSSFAVVDYYGNLGSMSINVDTAGDIYALARQSDGGLIVGGNFTRVNGEERRGLLRLRADGSLDPNWRTNTDGTVHALAIDSADGIYAGGRFRNVDDATNSYSRSAAIKLRGNGTVIDAWSFPADFGSEVYALALSGPADLYVGGHFDAAGRQNFVKATQSSGGLQAGFSPPQPSGAVNAIAVTQDGSAVFIGGDFFNVGATYRAGLAKFAGTNGALMSWTADIRPMIWIGSVKTLGFGNSGSSLYVGGYYWGIGDCWECNYLASVSVDSGAVSPQFRPWPNGPVYSLYVWDYVVDDPAIYVGGAFSAIGGGLRNNAAKLSIDGSADVLWNPSFDGPVNALTSSGTANLAVGGGFNRIDAQSHTSLGVFPRAGSNLIFANGFER